MKIWISVEPHTKAEVQYIHKLYINIPRIRSSTIHPLASVLCTMLRYATGPQFRTIICTFKKYILKMHMFKVHILEDLGVVLADIAGHVLVVGLVGASADLQQLGVSPQPLHLVFTHIAVAAQHLYRNTHYVWYSIYNMQLEYTTLYCIIRLIV
jgi:hypothetical protein